MATDTTTGSVCYATITTILFVFNVTFERFRQSMSPHDKGPKQLSLSLSAISHAAEILQLAGLQPISFQTEENQPSLSTGTAADGELGALGGSELARDL